MGWPYQFITLSDEEKELRHQSLAFYAAVAHLSAFAPALIYLLARLVQNVRERLVSKDGGYQEVPGSPALKSQRVSGGASRWARLGWWMGDDVYVMGRHWGQRDEWIAGISWTAWMLVLCVRGTGQDYLHLTKRFGLIAASQFPIQCLLSLKRINPFAWAFFSSHEHVNRYHRVLGRVIYGLLVLHIIFYNIFFVASGIWEKRFFAPVVREGVIASLLLHALIATSSSFVRNRSYRLFFFIHQIFVWLAPTLIFFHASSARYYIVAGVVLLAIDLAARRRQTIYSAPSTLETVPGTNLIRIEATISPSQIPSFQARPGSHVFVQIPPASRPSRSLASGSNYIFELTRNPFTVSSVNAACNTITLIARRRAGPLTNHLSTLSSSSTDSPVTLDIQGPYGAIGKSLPSLLAGAYDRILLFAGGVGATFALPAYRAIHADSPTAHVTLVWAVRSAAEATWATSSAPDSSSSSGAASVLDDKNVQLFLTGDMGVADTSGPSGGEGVRGVEMADLRRGERGGRSGVRNRKRPDVRKIVDDTFRKGREESVAVIVCGPAEMVRDVREGVRPWAMKGRRVWWHSEAFGW
ncbi:hypothetical protein ACO1O0_007263 [Amphichorda felina]